MLRKLEYGKRLYYHDELTDDFVKTKRRCQTRVDGSYRYRLNAFERGIAWFLHYFVACPFMWVLTKLKYGVKVRGKKNLRAVKKSGYVLYGNHTQMLDCAFGYVYGSFPKRSYIIASKETVCIPFVRGLVRLLGAMPVPDDLDAMRRFTKEIDERLQRGHAIVVLPEAHIWPYYTGVRDFPSTSFRYAAKNNVPALPMFTTYRKPRGLFKRYRKPRVTLVIGEPVYADPSKSVKANAQAMRDAVYDFMRDTAQELNEISLYRYIRVPEPIETEGQLRALRRKKASPETRQVIECVDDEDDEDEKIPCVKHC